MTGRTASARDSLSTTLAALADPTRRQMVQMLGQGPKPVGELAGAFSLSAPAISKHLRVLRHGLIVEEERHARDARLRIYRLRREPLDDLDAWLAHMRTFWQLQLGAFAAHVAATAPKPKRRARKATDTDQAPRLRAFPRGEPRIKQRRKQPPR